MFDHNIGNHVSDHPLGLSILVTVYNFQSDGFFCVHYAWIMLFATCFILQNKVKIHKIKKTARLLINLAVLLQAL
jgi:hypothetical protein